MKTEPLTVADCMTPTRITINAATSITEAVQILLKHHVLGSAVVDKEGHLVGYISEQDCLKQLLTDSYHSEDSAQVADVMRRDVLTVNSDMSIVDLAQTMTGDKPKKYPVVEHHRLIGEITRTQVVQALLKLRAWRQASESGGQRAVAGMAKPLAARAPSPRN